MKNKIDDLRNHLFAQLERLADESLSGNDLDNEIKRGKAIRHVADGIISSAKAETERLQTVGELQISGGSALMGRQEQVALEGGGK